MISKLATLSAALLLAACCVAPSHTPTLSARQAEARFNEVLALAIHEASSEGHDARFSKVSHAGDKTLLADGVITFSAEGMVVAGHKCTINNGRYLFEGTPVVKGIKSWTVGDQQTMVFMIPDDEGRYALEIRGMASTSPRGE